MDSSEQHLELALAEYDGKISILKNMGASEEYLEALVNRSSILIMLESYDDAISDLECAMKVADTLEENGEEVNVGSYVKIYENHGLIMYDRDAESMKEDYGKIVPKLKLMKKNTRHYDRTGQISMCIDCAMDLLDFKFYSECVPFLENGRKLLKDDSDVWSRNRYADLLDMYGQVLAAQGDEDKAISYFSKSIEIGRRLYESSGNDDPVDLANTLIRRGDLYGKKGLPEDKIKDHTDAVSILEQLYEMKKFSDAELLASVHKELASYMMENGDIETAERHLLRSMKLEMPEIKSAMNTMKDYK